MKRSVIAGIGAGLLVAGVGLVHMAEQQTQLVPPGAAQMDSWIYGLVEADVYSRGRTTFPLSGWQLCQWGVGSGALGAALLAGALCACKTCTTSTTDPRQQHGRGK